MTEYFDSIAKRIASIFLTLAISFALFACADIGERDNPVDPGYKGARIEELSSSSSWSLDVSSSSSWSLAIGSMTDSRDGQTYKTVTIGTQTWMAENLNYKTSSSYCYGDNAGNCSKYGRLYEWSAAMDACPTGWHLPNDGEWSVLRFALDLWTAIDEYSAYAGFAVLPAGNRSNDGRFHLEGEFAFFWSSTGYDNYGSDVWRFDYYGDFDGSGWSSEDDGFSVRCLRDSDERSEGAGSDDNYGSLTDFRDGQEYKTVKIGTQTWMAENLNYDPGDVSDIGSYAWSGCYDNARANCSKYGRLYTYKVAMGNAGCGNRTYCYNGYEGPQGVCPSGWHLPSFKELNILWIMVGGFDAAKLKSSSGWYDGGNGTDFFGFAVLPAGGRDYAHIFSGEGSYAGFWSGSFTGHDDAGQWSFNYDDDVVHLSGGGENSDLALSVRCLKD